MNVTKLEVRRDISQIAEDKINKELKEFKGNGKARVISAFVAQKLKLFCSNEAFAVTLADSEKTLSECCSDIVKGIGNHASDIEVYRKAAQFYFPDAKVDIVLYIDVDGMASEYENPPEPIVEKIEKNTIDEQPITAKLKGKTMVAKKGNEGQNENKKSGLIQMSLFD